MALSFFVNISIRNSQIQKWYHFTLCRCTPQKGNPCSNVKEQGRVRKIQGFHISDDKLFRVCNYYNPLLLSPRRSLPREA